MLLLCCIFSKNVTMMKQFLNDYDYDDGDCDGDDSDGDDDDGDDDDGDDDDDDGEKSFERRNDVE